MKRLVVILLLFAVGFVRAQEERVDPPQIAIKIGMEETIELDGTLVTFSEVLEDSRCPREVQCVWAGRARVSVRIVAPEGDEISRELIFGAKKQEETVNRIVVETDDFHYEAIGVSPYPQVPGEELDYSLLIKKVKKKD